MKKVIVVIPAYNEEKTVGDIVRQCFSMSHALVVDDGSTDNTVEVAKDAGAIVVSHPINRGLGAALSTGITGALRLGADIIITLDADGQHDPADTSQIIKPIIEDGADVVIGSRFLNKKAKIPWHRCLANLCGNFFTWILFGIWVSDSQSGFRAFSADAVQKMELRTSTMEVSSEIIRETVRLKIKMAEVPIAVKYTAYSLSKGQGFFRGLETLWKLIVLRFFR